MQQGSVSVAISKARLWPALFVVVAGCSQNNSQKPLNGGDAGPKSDVSEAQSPDLASPDVWPDLTVDEREDLGDDTSAVEIGMDTDGPAGIDLGSIDSVPRDGRSPGNWHSRAHARKWRGSAHQDPCSSVLHDRCLRRLQQLGMVGHRTGRSVGRSKLKVACERW
jgi:hypothetical protein